MGFIPMLSFCGQERCLMDKNGRIRLTQRWVEDFLQSGRGEVVMHGLPEGAIALYPETTYHQIRAAELQGVENLGSSFAYRSSLRRFGALTLPEKISAQGRITLPEALCQYAGVTPGSEVTLVGVEIGVEIWNTERFAAEMAAIQEHLTKKREQEMTRDITEA